VIKCDTRRWVAKTGVTKKIGFLVAAYVVVQHAFATSSVNEKIARKAIDILIFTSLANIN
jgi:hydrogenase maturation factor